MRTRVLTLRDAYTAPSLGFDIIQEISGVLMNVALVDRTKVMSEI